MSTFHLRASLLLLMLASASFVRGQQPALVIHRVFTNPAGNDSPFEFVELLATRSIDFSAEPFTIVAADGSGANANGWTSGGSGSYAFQISSGTAARGDLVYVGGSSLGITGTACKILRQINTATTGGDGFGTPAAAGVMGNGGGQADGIGVFNMQATAITNTTIPVDAVFFGASAGTVITKGFEVPAGDLYQGGIFGAAGNTFIAPDPGSDDYISVAGAVFYSNSFTWGTARSWNLTKAKPDCGSPANISFQVQNSLSLSIDYTRTTASINPPYVSAVVNDAADPAAVQGIALNLNDNGVPIPAASYTLSAASSNAAVLGSSNILITRADGNAIVKLVPSGAGYSAVTFTLQKGSSSASLTINFAASDPGALTAATVWHTGISDASAAIALDDDYMVVGDDENNRFYVHARKRPGLPVTSFYYGDLLGLTDGNPGNYKEADLEAGVKSVLYPGRQYWLGSMSNGNGGEIKPNRNRLFAFTATGTGSSTAFAFQGVYSNLRQQIINWGDANGYNLTASAAGGKDSKEIDGFNAEGMAFGPDGALYIALRAPLVPVTSRSKALIAPLLNFENWFAGGSPSGNPSFGAPIELDLGGRGIRDIERLSGGLYIILAGNYQDMPLNGAVFTWTGNRNDQPQLAKGFAISSLNAEAVLEVRSSGGPVNNQLQVLSDNGSAIYYGDGTEAKDLSQNNFKKYRSDVMTAPVDALPLVFEYFQAEKRSTQTWLTWKIADLKQLYDFEVERAADGRDFNAIARVKPADGQLLYRYADTSLPGTSYYRIRAGHAAGNTALSVVRMVSRAVAASPVKLYPNPAGNGVVSVVAGNTDKKQVLIYTPTGKLYRSISFSGTADVPVSGWPKGIYVFVVTTTEKNAVFTGRVVVQ